MDGYEGNGRAPGGTRRGEGRRALFSTGQPQEAQTAAGAPAAAGRRALFSEPERGRPDGTGSRPGLVTAVVHCRTCLERTPMSLAGLAFSLMPSLWLPLRPWPRLMRCPACRRVSWCRLEWLRPGAAAAPADHH